MNKLVIGILIWFMVMVFIILYFKNEFIDFIVIVISIVLAFTIINFKDD